MTNIINFMVLAPKKNQISEHSNMFFSYIFFFEEFTQHQSYRGVCPIPESSNCGDCVRQTLLEA